MQRTNPAGTNTYLAASLLVNTRTGDNLTNKLYKVSGYCYAGLYDSKQRLFLDSSLSIIKEAGANKKWTKKYFEQVRTFAAITILTRLQKGCLNAATTVLGNIKQHLLD